MTKTLRHASGVSQPGLEGRDANPVRDPTDLRGRIPRRACPGRRRVRLQLSLAQAIADEHGRLFAR